METGNDHTSDPSQGCQQITNSENYQFRELAISLCSNTKLPFLPDMNSVSALPCLICEVEFTIYPKKVLVIRIICNKILKLCLYN